MDQTPRILVLGASGKVGRLLRAAPVPEFAYSAIWHSRTGENADWGWDILNEDPTDQDFDAILHLASGRSCSVTEEAEIALRVCDFARAAGSKSVFYASSQAVYPKDRSPVAEGVQVDPDSSYAEAKVAGEAAMQTYPSAVTLRIGNVAGADQLFDAMSEGPVTLDKFEDGLGPRRSYIGPISFLKALRILVERHLDGLLVDPVINFAQPRWVAMSDILVAANVAWRWQDADHGKLQHFELDTARLENEIELPTAHASDLLRQAMAAGWSPSS